MSANISSESGRVEFAYAGAAPWHRLGVQVPGLMTVAEALRFANLDWQVRKVPALSSHDLAVVPDQFVVIRTDTARPLGVVGRKYTPISNQEAFAFFDHALGAGQGQIETAGALGHGERVFMMARLPEEFEPVPGDPVQHYLLVSTSHDGSRSIEVLFTNVRVVCQNTLTAALDRCVNKVTIRHTESAEARLREAHRMLTASGDYWTRMQEVCIRLAQSSVTRVEVGAFLDAMFPPRTKAVEIALPAGAGVMVRHEEQEPNHGRQEVLRLLDEGHGADLPGVQGTGWGLLNAYTEWLDHERVVRGGGVGAAWERSVFGAGQQDRQRAVDSLLAMAA